LKFDICENFHTIFVQESEEDSSGRAEKADFKEMMEQLKEKFSTTKTRSEKVKVLTVLPRSWSGRKIASEFNTTRHTAAVAKK
jgi:hypothetical protein